MGTDCSIVIIATHIITLLRSDLIASLFLLHVWNLLHDIIALSGDLRCALKLRNCLQHIDTVHVRNKLALLKSDNSL